MKLSVLVNCFNEKATIMQAINEARALNVDKEIIVIDNCSTDGTKEILEKLRQDGDLNIVIHPVNYGAGYSAAEGIRLAKGDYFYSPGADLEYRMSDVCKMLDKADAEDLDVVFGSRLLDRQDVPRFQLIKERPFWLGSIISTVLVNFLYGRHFSDIIATKLIKTDILKRLDCKANNQAFEFELVSKLCKCGFKIGEVSVWYKPRTHKEGKTIRALDMLPAIIAILKVKFFWHKLK